MKYDCIIIDHENNLHNEHICLRDSVPKYLNCFLNFMIITLTINIMTCIHRVYTQLHFLAFCKAIRNF